MLLPSETVYLLPVLLVVFALPVVIWRKNVANFSPKKFETAQTVKKVPKVPLQSGEMYQKYQKYRKQMNGLLAIHLNCQQS